MAADRSGRLPLTIGDAVPPAYLELPDADERELSAIRMAQAVLAAPDVLPTQREALLAHAVDLFLGSRAGPLGVRFRTPAVMQRATPAPVRLHRVRPPEEVLAELLAGGPELVPLLLLQATACLVTDAEYRRLEAVTPAPMPGLQGWDRYAAADLTVVDLRDGEEFDPALPPGDSWDREQLQHLVRGGPARICLLLACRLTSPGTTVSWAVEAAGRDAEAPEGWWLEARAAAPEQWTEAARVRRAVSALTFAGRVFQSPALQRAGALLATLPVTDQPSLTERSRLAADLVRCADLEDPGPGARNCRPLAVELLQGIAAVDPRRRAWEEMLAQAGDGRYAAVLHAGSKDTHSTMRTIARLFDDPVLDVTLTVFVLRYRQVLPEPPADVLQWLRDRWR